MATEQNNNRPGEQTNRPPIVPGTADNREAGSGRLDAEPSLGAGYTRPSRGNSGAAAAMDDIAAASAMVGANASHQNQANADDEADTTTNNYAASGVEHGTTPSGADAGAGSAGALSGADLNDADAGTGSASRSRTRNDIDTDLGGTASGTMSRSEDDMDAALSDDDDIVDMDDDDDFEDDDDDTFLDDDEDEDNYSGR